jgi:hypothetical protein
VGLSIYLGGVGTFFVVKTKKALKRKEKLNFANPGVNPNNLLAFEIRDDVRFLIALHLKEELIMSAESMSAVRCVLSLP